MKLSFGLIVDGYPSAIRNGNEFTFAVEIVVCLRCATNQPAMPLKSLLIRFQLKTHELVLFVVSRLSNEA